MTTEERVRRLEREVRWTRLGGALAMLALACVVLVGAGQNREKPKVVDEVRAKRFVAVGEDGREFLVIGDAVGLPGSIPPPPKGTKSLTMFGSDGRVISMSPDWPMGATLLLRQKSPGTVFLHAGAGVSGLQIDAGGTREDAKGIWLKSSESGVRLFMRDRGDKSASFEPVAK